MCVRGIKFQLEVRGKHQIHDILVGSAVQFANLDPRVMSLVTMSAIRATRQPSRNCVIRLAESTLVVVDTHHPFPLPRPSIGFYLQLSFVPLGADRSLTSFLRLFLSFPSGYLPAFQSCSRGYRPDAGRPYREGCTPILLRLPARR
ncbi:hypothetical protein EYR40_008661 [Pleurotus pulmonarius]|nr:hypothetical protein EYR36_009480 [Pleurotus pulmonarius]KAF4593867.1 hypothetical protein EYR40_008661 [Pleurotus pulmonarius]